MRSSRGRAGVVEAVLAVAIVLSIAAATAGSGPSSRETLAKWGRTGVPAITALVEDLAPIQREVSVTSPGGPDVSAVDVVALRSQLADVRQLKPPPTAATAAAWNTALTEIATALRLVAPAGPHPSDATAKAIAAELSAAGQHLLGLGQTIQLG
jgi:hypothetical protein